MAANQIPPGMGWPTRVVTPSFQMKSCCPLVSIKYEPRIWPAELTPYVRLRVFGPTGRFKYVGFCAAATPVQQTIKSPHSKTDFSFRMTTSIPMKADISDPFAVVYEFGC